MNYKNRTKYFFFMIMMCIFLVGCGVIPQNNQKGNNVNGDKPESQKNILDLSGQNLKRVPNEVFEKTNLEELDLSDNEIEGAIQAEVRHLTKLRVLDLSNNKMTGLPAEVGQLHYLEELNLSNNEFTGLPYELGNLKKLKILDISGNSYSELDLNRIQEQLPVGVSIVR